MRAFRQSIASGRNATLVDLSEECTDGEIPFWTIYAGYFELPTGDAGAAGQRKWGYGKIRFGSAGVWFTGRRWLEFDILTGTALCIAANQVRVDIENDGEETANFFVMMARGVIGNIGRAQRTISGDEPLDAAGTVVIDIPVLARDFYLSCDQNQSIRGEVLSPEGTVLSLVNFDPDTLLSAPIPGPGTFLRITNTGGLSATMQARFGLAC